MPMSRALALSTATFIAASVLNTASAANLSLVGSSTMVCQLVGETIWHTGTPGTTTAAKTLSNFGLAGVDLGFPVDSGSGPLYFLFGDGALHFLPTVADHPPNSLPTVPPDDALGYTSRTTPPDTTTCLDLQLATSAPKKFAHPTVTPTIQQGSFNVPTGGVFFDNKFYAFFWTDHCLTPSALTPNPRTPLRLPAPGACLETPHNSSIGRSVLAEASPLSPLDFHWQPPPEGLLFTNMPSGFVYTSAANPPPAIPGPLASAIPVFGVPRYRASIPYMALAPRATFGDPRTWLFFAGYEFGHPVWITRQKWESGHNAAGEWTPPTGAEIFAAEPADERCVGEHSVTWNTPLHAWLLLYTCVPWVVEARFAPQPWGPWSTPIILLSAVQDPGLNCTLIQNVSLTGCPLLANEQKLPSGTPWPGAFYAPFVMTRYTQDVTPPGPGQPKRATIYWLLSTWNPYTVVVMQSTLELQ